MLYYIRLNFKLVLKKKHTVPFTLYRYKTCAVVALTFIVIRNISSLLRVFCFSVEWQDSEMHSSLIQCPCTYDKSCYTNSYILILYGCSSFLQLSIYCGPWKYGLILTEGMIGLQVFIADHFFKSSLSKDFSFADIQVYRTNP